MDFSYNGHQRAGPSSHLSTQSANGPNTFDEALRHLISSMEERNDSSGEPFYGSSPAEPPVVPHSSHLSPQGYPAERIYDYHGQYAPPNQAIPASYHQVLSNASYTSYLPHHYSQHRAHQSHSTPGIQPSSHPQAPPNLQSIGDIRSRWIALQTQSTTWAPDTIEPRDLSGESPLMAFVERSEGRYQCQVPVEDGGCGKENIKKDRMLAHIRKEHLHFRPLACGGRCGLIGCQMSFPSKSALTDHVHPRKAKCACGKEMYAQNLKEHQMKACPQRFT